MLMRFAQDPFTCFDVIYLDVMNLGVLHTGYMHFFFHANNSVKSAVPAIIFGNPCLICPPCWRHTDAYMIYLDVMDT